MKLSVSLSKPRASILVIALLIVSFVLAGRNYANAGTPGSIIIHEIMYNPASDNQDEEFLELYNTTNATIDLEGWCFTSGINLCFSAGISIGSHDYLIISPNSAQTLTTYASVTDATYTGNLSNGGETLTLKDELSNTIDTLSYDDGVPWPTTPDGGGPSLELKDSSLDNSIDTSWGASLNSGGTINTQNSIFGLNTPEIIEIGKPSGITPADQAVVTVSTTNADSASLIYKVMFEAEQNVVMLDDGTGADETASDNIFSAYIPAQSDGELVRYKVSVVNSNGTSTKPSADDTINYFGYVVETAANSGLPEVNWYMEEDDYTDLITNHQTDDFFLPAVLAIGDEVFDNSQVRIKGEVSVNYPKKKYKFELPTGYKVGAPFFDIPVDEFMINRWGMPSMATSGEYFAWKAAELAGFKIPQNKLGNVFKNSPGIAQDSQGLYLIIEDYDKQWRERNGYEEGALYKTGVSKKTRLDEDDSDIQSLVSNISNLSGEDLRLYLADNLNIPAIINYHALMTVTRAQDWGFDYNIYEYRDTEGSERWEYLPWDLDSAFALTYLETNQDWLLKPPVTDQHGGPNDLETALYQFPEYEEMYYRRSIELFNDLYGSDNSLQEWADQTYDQTKDSIDNDLAIWRSSYVDIVAGIDAPIDIPGVYTGTVESFYEDMDSDILGGLYNYDIQKFRSGINNYISQGLLPSIQSESPSVIISELNYNPSSSQDHEYIELYNPNNVAIDVSGWTLDSSATHTLQGGSVIPANSYALIVKNDPAFRQQYGPGKLILGTYQGNLSNNGESITLKRKDGSVASTFSYQNSGEWSPAANGQGSSLALIRVSANESLAACWAPSGNGGTPGLTNTNLDASWIAVNGVSCSDRIIDRSGLSETGSDLTILHMLATSASLMGALTLLNKGFRKSKKFDV